MNNYKHFIAGVSNVVLGDVNIITENHDGVKPRVSNFVKLIDAVKFQDGFYHTYYEELKAIMKSFIVYWRETMDSAVKQADYHLHKAPENVTKELVLLHVANTIDAWQEYEIKFYKEFLPIESAQQQKTYDDLIEKFKDHMNKLHEIKLQVEKMDRKEKVLEFAKEQYTKAVELKDKVFLYTHEYLSMLLADHLPEIDGSLKEILNQTRNNLKQLENERENTVTELLNKLYDKNKEQLMYSRRRCASSQCRLVEADDLAAYLMACGAAGHGHKLGCDIEKIRAEVLNSGNHQAIWNVTEKLELFEKRYANFEHIAKNLNMLKAELENTYKEESIYNSRMTTELPGTKNWCWQEMGKNFAIRKEELKQLLIKAAEALSTFFVVRSATEERTVFNNDMGRYSIDMYGHLVYHFDYGRSKYHLNCEGNYRKPNDQRASYQDENGRYFLINNAKIYQKADCASLYKLGDDKLLKKISIDCGHSEGTNKECGVGIQDRSDDPILPEAQPIDIKSSLKSDVVTYLWDAFGSILPDVLYDVCQRQPKNPVHYLAHSLLKHKYSKTTAELLQKKKESEAYRANILKERKDQAIADTLAWKTKQVQRRKPEESDDAYNDAIRDIYVATNQFIMSLDDYF